MMGTYKNTTEMVDLYVDLISKFPSIIALIDPFRKEVKGFALSFIIRSHSFGSVICVIIWAGNQLLSSGIYGKRHLLSK